MADQSLQVYVGVDLRADGHAWLTQRAVAWCGRTAATIHLVNVHAPAANDLEDRRQRLSELLEAVPTSLRGAPKLIAGAPEDALVSLTDGADLLVVGSREPAVFERWLHGPMAARVLRHTRCPVLVPRREDPPGRPPRLLVGVDTADAEAAASVLTHADRWATLSDGTVDALYSVPQTLPPIADRAVRDQAEREWAAAHEATRQALTRWLEQYVAVERRGRALLSRGEPDDVLIQESKRYDLLLVGNRARSGIAQLVLGSVSQRVVRQAACDVLTLPTAHELGSVTGAPAPERLGAP